MIEIRVYSRNKAEAAEIANKIADVYRESRLSERERMAERGIAKIARCHRRPADQGGPGCRKSWTICRRQFRITDLMMDSWSARAPWRRTRSGGLTVCGPKFEAELARVQFDPGTAEGLGSEPDCAMLCRRFTATMSLLMDALAEVHASWASSWCV
ncbi:MAG: hypothetical protein V9G14_05640 [Cypionkella sp.]